MPSETRATMCKTRHRDRKDTTRGHAYIKFTFSNTTVSLTGPQGTVITWCSSDQVGFRDSHRSIPYTAQLATGVVAWCVQERGMKKVDVFVKGPGSGHETMIRSLQAAGPEVDSITGVTPQAFNGYRPPKRRRV